MMINHDSFQLDERLQCSSFQLIDWPLSRVLLKNNADYPWFMLVPRRAHLTELTDLSQSDQYQLMDELHQLSLVVRELFKPEKLNIGALGNMVSQLHLHVVGRFHHDPLWPQGIWQGMAKEKLYVEPDCLIKDLKKRLRWVVF